MQKTYLADSAYEIIKDRILKCIYAPKTLISEDQLVTDLGISRTPIRSALVRLEKEYLVQIISKKGILITDISYEQIHDVYECRCLLESYAISNYGNRFSKQELQNFLKQFKAPLTDMWSFFHHDNLFHMQIIGLCGNSLFSEYYESIQNLNLRISALSTVLDNRLENSNEEHISIINALLRDEFSLAEQLLLEHLSKAKQAAYALLENDKTTLQ